MRKITLAGTFTKMFVHLVFAVKGRQSLIIEDWEEMLHKYIAGIILGKGQKPLAINGMPDHIHILVGVKPTLCIADLVREIKKSSNEFINQKRLTKDIFQWQEGYGAFTCCISSLDNVIRYILNQKTHHQSKLFKQEFIGLLQKDQIMFDEKYLFDWIDY